MVIYYEVLSEYGVGNRKLTVSYVLFSRDMIECGKLDESLNN